MNFKGKNRCAGGMTMVEMIVAVAIFVVMAGAMYTSTLAMQHFTTTAVTDIDLQESARNALQKMVSDLRMAGRVTVNGLTFPRFGNFCTPALSSVPSAYGLPSGYGNFLHPQPALVNNYAAFTAPSREIIFVEPVVPASATAPNLTPYSSTSTGTVTVNYGTTTTTMQQIAYIVQKDPVTGLNSLERWVYDTATSSITSKSRLATGVQRIEIDDYGQPLDYYNGYVTSAGATISNSPFVYSGPGTWYQITQNQLFITLYCAAIPDYDTSKVVQTILSASVDMRNNSEN